MKIPEELKSVRNEGRRCILKGTRIERPEGGFAYGWKLV